MTTMFPAFKLCAVCGETSEHMLISSTSSFGSMDLDTRPPPLARDTLAQDIERCPNCGYCAPDISEETDLDLGLLTDVEYQAVLNTSSGKPAIACEFEAAALIATREDRHADAGWCFLKAAWICDDEQAKPKARAFRMEALKRWSVATASGQTFAADATSEALMTIDIMRRSRLFAEVLDLIDNHPPPRRRVPHRHLALRALFERGQRPHLPHS